MAKILVIDDNASIRQSIWVQLQNNSYNILDAENGPEGLEIIGKEKPELVFIDSKISDPGSMELLKQIRKEYPSRIVQIIMIVNRNDVKFVEESIKLGANDYITKPLDPWLLRAKVNKCLKDLAVTENLYFQNNTFNSIIQSIDAGILMFDTKYKIVIANNQLAELFECKRAYLIGKDYRDIFGQIIAPKLFQENNSCRQLQWNSFFTGERFTTELQISGNPPRYYQLKSGPVRDIKSKIIGQLEIYKDITERKLLQNEILHTEKMMSMGNLVSGAAHELNNPLMGVIGYTQLLMESNLDEASLKSLDNIHKEAQRLRKIIKNLFSFAQKHKPEKTFEDLHAILDNVLELMEYELKHKNVKVIKKYDSNLPGTMLDKHQIKQVFFNIIQNSEQAMADSSESGVITLVTQIMPATNENENDKIQIIFSDTGCGITQENIKKIFDPFFSTKGVGMGTGLGLSTAYGIVRSHDGRITVNSQEGNGTVFTVELPVIASHVKEKTQEIKKPVQELQNIHKCILVIDDDENILTLLKKYLEKKKHRVHCAQNGLHALKLIKNSRYDIILSDLRMPEMDGEILHKTVKKWNPQLAKKIVFMSGDTINPKTQQFLCSVKNFYLKKPFHLDEIIDVIEKIHLKEINAQQHQEKEQRG